LPKIRSGILKTCLIENVLQLEILIISCVPGNCPRTVPGRGVIFLTVLEVKNNARPAGLEPATFGFVEVSKVVNLIFFYFFFHF
jgi:hypothetical protein